MFRRSAKSSNLPGEGQGFDAYYMCDVPTCGYTETVSPAKREQWEKEPGKMRRDPNFSPKIQVFLCPKCNKFTMVQAEEDSETKKVYLTSDSKGNEVPPPAWLKKPAE
jgi:ssDNA-binding Zn-finger/Zn-ribbon topoisomerase 1